jgi:hypothetical protein
MSLVNINDTAIQPKSIHFTDGGDFEPDGNETLQGSDWYHTGVYTDLADNYQQIVSVPGTFTSGHAYLVSLNIALNVIPYGGASSVNSWLSSWQIQARMGGNNVAYTEQHYTSISPQFETLSTNSVSMPQSFIIVMDTSRKLDLYITCNADAYVNYSLLSATWGINNSNLTPYVVSGQISVIDLGNVNTVVYGVPPVPPPQPIPPVYDPVPPLLQNQGGILTNLAGLVVPIPTNKIYPPII